MTSSTNRDKDAALDWESAGLQLIDATLYASLRACWDFLQIVDSKWWPETGSNRRRRPFQGRALPLSYLALA